MEVTAMHLINKPHTAQQRMILTEAHWVMHFLQKDEEPIACAEKLKPYAICKRCHNNGYPLTVECIETTIQANLQRKDQET